MLIAIALFVLGLILGSFVNALVWRLRQRAENPPSPPTPLKLRWSSRQQRAGREQKTLLRQGYRGQAKNNQYPIFKGRSQCPRCGHQLSVAELVPVLSWLFLRGRCRYCRQPISVQYPLVEIAGAVVFALSYYSWPNPGELVLDTGGVGPIGTGQWLLFTTWLVSFVGLLALLVYDVRWMLLPNHILYPTFLVAFGGRLAYIWFFEQDKIHSFWIWGASLLVASGIFWLLFIISSGRWIGYGDVRLGLVTGTLLTSPAKSFLMIFLASILASLFVMPLLISKRKGLGSKLPYGPFLITATVSVLLFGDSIIGWYTQLLT